MNETKINTVHLLDNVTEIRKKYDEIARITGANFNIFKVLKMEHKEVHPHSSLISELLNEKGSHGQGNLFLNLFLKIINNRIDNTDRKIDYFINSYSDVEYGLDQISNDGTEGGRLDIIVEDSNQLIIIENKIGADDQKNQLLRYYNFAKKTNKKFIILYLWKFDYELTEKDDQYTLGETTEQRKAVLEKTLTISYQTDIKEWISLCLKEVYNMPLIREVLAHYLSTINTITNQSTNNKMEEDIINNILSDKNKLESALYLINNKENIFKSLLDKIAKNIEENNTTGANFNYKQYSNGKDKGAEFRFIFKDFDIILNVGSTDYYWTSFGVWERDDSKLDENIKNEIKSKLSSCKFGKIENWPNWVWITRYANWSDSKWEELVDVKFSKGLINDVTTIFNLII